MFQILVVEDNKNARRLMEAVLMQNGYWPLSASDGVEAMEVLEKQHVDLIVLDLMMPRMDGWQFMEELRGSGSEIPVLIVSARETPEDKKRGFQLGTDDYMVKPVDEEEMILRIGALLRRSHIATEHKLTCGATVLDYDQLTVVREQDRQELPRKEFLLLFKLLSYPGKIFTRRQLMDEIWGMETETDERTVDVHVKRLRDRFEANPDFEISTVRGLGYKAVKKA